MGGMEGSVGFEKPQHFRDQFLFSSVASFFTLRSFKYLPVFPWLSLMCSGFIFQLSVSIQTLYVGLVKSGASFFGN